MLTAHEADCETTGTGSTNHRVIFVWVFLLLIALTGLSFWIANSHLMEHRVLAWAAMIAVSIAKAMLVVMFFMHLWWERAWKYVLTIPTLIMAILLVTLLVPDVALRTETYSRERQMDAAEAFISRAADGQ